MALIFVIILGAIALVVAVVLIIVSNMKKNEKIKYYTAAGNTLREDFLNYSLQNHTGETADIRVPRSSKMMIYLKANSKGKKVQLVFDPEREINIGRDTYSSNIYINDVTVSQKHCCIYSVDDHVYLKDLYSANGTYLKRGAFKRYHIVEGESVELFTKDTIIVGSNEFKVTLFYYDMAVM